MRQMKPSGIEWVGDIPMGWEVKPLKAILIQRTEKNYPIKTNYILSLTIDKGVIPYCEKLGGGNKAKEDLSQYHLAYPNDIVLNSMNIISGAVGLSKYFGAVSPVYYTLFSKHTGISTSYYNNLFQTKEFQDSLLGFGNGIMVKKSESSGKFNTVRLRIPISKLNIILLPNPKGKEQKAIACYLDSKCNLINNIIEKQKTVIEKLQSYKQSLITEVVTKGLNPNVKMKTSGIEWIGDIPEGWEVRKLKYEFRNLDMLRQPISSENRTSGENMYDYYGASGVIDKVSDYIFDEPLILIGEDGANLLLRNLPLIYVATGKYWVNNHAHILKPKAHKLLIIYGIPVGTSRFGYLFVWINTAKIDTG